MAEVISVVSGKGGVGKTLLSASLGMSFANKGKKTLLIDGDMGLRSLDIVLGLESESLFHFWDLAQGKCFTEEAILPVYKNLDFLPGTFKEGWKELFVGAVDAIIEDVSSQYDIVILDCPAGIGFEIKEAEKYSHKMLVVIAPLWTSKRAAERLVSDLEQKTSVFYVLNQMLNNDDEQISFSKLYSCLDEDLFLAAIPYSIKAFNFYQEGKISDFMSSGAFKLSVDMITDILSDGVNYKFDKWKNILEKADDENVEILKKKFGLKYFDVDKSKMYSGTNYKWRRRRW